MNYKALGKFLITGEYLVLHGATALCLPLNKKHQTLKVSPNNIRRIKWAAFDENEGLWFSAEFTLPSLELHTTSDANMGSQLQALFRYIQKKIPQAFDSGLDFETHMNFSRLWGLGSSSTLISLLSQWSGINGFELQKKIFGGSGYDVACATSDTPLTYQLQERSPTVIPVAWSPSFKQHLYFLYLGKKQDSRIAMEQFKKQTADPSQKDISNINQLTKQFISAKDLKDFQSLMREHEQLISKILDVKAVKEKLFPDFDGELKSLGGWGGDFIMVATEKDPERYFQAKDLNLLFRWDDLIL